MHARIGAAAPSFERRAISDLTVQFSSFAWVEISNLDSGRVAAYGVTDESDQWSLHAAFVPRPEPATTIQ